jgi:hypothetical protein
MSGNLLEKIKCIEEEFFCSSPSTECSLSEVDAPYEGIL